ncbi:MAG: FAD binding domain-containing protein [Alphaproteobacteria bacterium]|nr:hypothetical protein [Rhodospirillaceae bacterium]MDP6404082.1 FAD binding domain-containing protein [Alphaproteobacteria bacterium]MDP6624425.1 FAD binding domain-containing protein [Alphaproteobacteria bacterium]
MLENIEIPETLEDAVGILADQPGAGILAGGTIAVAVLKAGGLKVQTLVDLSRLPIAGINTDGARISIGAMTLLSDLLENDALAFMHEAVRCMASPTIRNSATIGGNLIIGGDLGVCLLALQSELVVAGAEGVRRIPIDEYYTAGLRAGEILTAMEFDAPDRATWRHCKVMRKKAASYAVLSIAAVVPLNGSIVERPRIALGALAPTPVRARRCEGMLDGKPLDPEVVNAAATEALADIEPVDDAFASAWYRRRVLPVYLSRTLLADNE